MGVPKKISTKWLGQQKAVNVAKDINGEPNPSYVSQQKEIAEAEAELARWEKFLAVAASKGFRENAYSGKTKSGVTLDAGRGFYTKENGRVVLFTREEVATLIDWKE